MSDIVSWPWPRIIVSQYKCYLVSGSPGGNLTLSELFFSSANYWGILPVLNLGAYADVRELSIADFGPFYVVCTFGYDAMSLPIRQMFVRNLSVALGFAFASFVVQTNPLCGVCANFNGQFVGANISAALCSSWDGLSSRSVLWSAIGTFELDPQINVEAGYTQSLGPWPTNQSVQVYALRQLGEQIVAYTDAGAVILSPRVVGSMFAYGQQSRHSVGILSGNHVAGDNTIHGFIDVQGEFWLVTSDGNITRRGYREFLRTLLDSSNRTIVSYVPHEQTFYVSNGIECVIINRYCAYKTHQMIASAVQLQDGNTVGTFITGTDTEARITCDNLDFGSRGIKSVEALLADVTHPAGTTVTLSTNWRMAKSDTFSSRPWIASGPIGRSVLRTAALDFQPRARFSSFTDVEFMGMLASIKYSDQRFKRGTVPKQYEVGEA